MNEIFNITNYCKEHDIEFNIKAPLSHYSSLKIGGPAEIIAFPDYKSLIGLLSFTKTLKMPYIVLGGGTNVLCPDKGFKGLVIITKNLKECYFDNQKTMVESGYSLWSLVQRCTKEGLSGMEYFAGIPGTVGGAVFGNAGAFGREMKDLVISVEIIDKEGKIRTLNNDELGFRYRGTSLSQYDFIVKVDLQLHSDDTQIINEKVKKYLLDKKKSQPLDKASAGCVFKNPEGDFAGRLIDKAGCKGMTEGDIMVSPIHANFFINTGNGTERQFITLANIIREKVYKCFNIILEFEIRFFNNQEML